MSGPRPSPDSSPSRVSRIVLTGFMGAGKSTVGALLAERLGWQLLDTDRLVENRAGLSVAAIFHSQGEAAFREMEAAAIRDASARDRVVIALGGGALERADTRALLAALPLGRIVFLDAPFDRLLARCAAHIEGPERPVLRDRERLYQRWQSRLPWYREAHLTLDTSGAEPRLVMERILDRLGALAPLAPAGARA